MNLGAWVRSVSAKFFHGETAAAEIDAELREHLALRADDLERSGMSRADAERTARIEFGGVERFRDDSYEALGGNSLDTLLQDARFSLRVLRKSPGFVVAAVVTLALAIGANAVVFGILNALVLRPLPVPNPKTLWAVENFDSYPNYIDLRDRNRSFESLAAWKMVFTAMDTGNDPESVWAYAASGNYFDVLGLKPSLGRLFHPSDERGANSAPYVVLIWSYWHSRFHEDPGVLGRTVLLGKQPFTIIGVAPRGFGGTLIFGSPQFIIPIVNQEQVDGDDLLHARGNVQGIFEMLGHLKPGVTQAQAAADLNGINAYLEKTYPKEVPSHDYTPHHPGLYVFGTPAKAFLAGLMLLAGLILLAACANLGSLFAARAADRGREVALRLALGSSRRRIVRQLLTEAALVSLAGGAVGLATSILLLKRLSVWQPFPSAPIQIPVTPDAKVYLAAIALALISGVLFGIVPVRQIMHSNPYEVVKTSATGRATRRLTLRDVLLTLQIAICGVLVTASLVAVRGLVRSLHSHYGFEPRNAMIVDVDLSGGGYKGDRALEMQKRLVLAMQATPGIQAAGMATSYPPLIYAAATQTHIFREDAQDFRTENAAAAPFRYDVSPGYLAAAQTALLAGRDLSWHDDAAAPRVVIVNQTLARKLFGSAAGAVGRSLKLQDGSRVEIVGVVEDGKYFSVTEDQESAVFLPYLQSPARATDLVVRSNRDPQQEIRAIRSTARQLDAGLPVSVDSYNSFLGVALFPGRVATVALGIMGLMGGVLSITGIFGMAAYSVSRRLRELGIRMALGAQRREVLEAALGRAVKLLGIGSAAGLALGILASRVLASIVYQATPRDPFVLGGVVLIMTFLGLIATWIPAQRALAIDPLVLLREE
ncbi:MAG TPA: ABC transporter permease [Acidobacteriaceae bacterium]|nr:ABC transporter permease [Acidobacteriaceae bacterium]